MKKNNIYVKALAISLIILGAILKINGVEVYSDVILTIGVFFGLFIATKKSLGADYKKRKSNSKLVISVILVFLFSLIISYLLFKK